MKNYKWSDMNPNINLLDRLAIWKMDHPEDTFMAGTPLGMGIIVFLIFQIAIILLIIAIK